MAPDPDLIALYEDLFTAHRETYAISPTPATWDDTLWSTMTEVGLTRLTGSEQSGGSGAGWIEAAALLRTAASVGVRGPFVEHDLLAGWLLETARLEVDDRRRTACAVDATGVAHAVGWASAAERIVILHPMRDSLAVSDVAREAVRVTPGTNRAGEPRDRVEVDPAALSGTPVNDHTAELFHLRGALARAIQVSGALEGILRLCLQHAESRVQFGRPLSKFQAIQHAVADIATEAALARTVIESAAVAVATDGWTDSTAFQIAVARSCLGHSASLCVRNGHQVHGAIGTTREHRLHEFTQAALAWRAEFGSVDTWDRTVARAAASVGSAGLWPLITGH